VLATSALPRLTGCATRRWQEGVAPARTGSLAQRWAHFRFPLLLGMPLKGLLQAWRLRAA